MYRALSVIVPGAPKVNEQLPAPAKSVTVQDEPLPDTVTVPVGAARPVPVTLTLTATACPTTEGLGVCETIVIALWSFVAPVD